MENDHNHNHTHGANKKTLLISFIIITSYMIVEGLGGFFTNSLALISDAGHMLSDSISLECIYALYKKNRRSLQIYGFSPCHEISIMLAS
jgi:cobalt-zinc-cadmium efflux system protein